jgi:hypothetical protein
MNDSLRILAVLLSVWYVGGVLVTATTLFLTIRGPEKQAKMDELTNRVGMSKWAIIFGFPRLIVKGLKQMRSQ